MVVLYVKVHSWLAFRVLIKLFLDILSGLHVPKIRPSITGESLNDTHCVKEPKPNGEARALKLILGGQGFDTGTSRQGCHRHGLDDLPSQP